ncbi:tRNA glutamyl-Q(34) synthetase GluQRS [Persicirhabdus sediminis]|uniref:tRNA glutamyl-Q(34) synthetase GluQRS n=1 Tax=Persicirhabdus sediminis TaxID=454144 RepID=A0A8J7MFT6_9BACT|nr:tRNA glutamyl-Q(34) synthetase GluQRS [Persicirhabdus sediminis]MBK1792020.1 tRNA glutamyl-Q(34) synthetase GluQRS [Persicirhabdus sediminis]
MRTRFAPSPTGYLHLGHAYAAMVAQKVAVDGGGEFLLRYEDIDRTRVREPYYEAIEEDLSWLGCNWQREPAPMRQLDRLGEYGAALDQLKELGVVYPCFCTRKEIQLEVAAMGNAPHGPEGVHYPGICKRLAADVVAEKLAAGDEHCWRLDIEKVKSSWLADGELSFTDLRYGVVVVQPDLLGDVVLARKDIATSYHLAVVVDDAAQRITHVTRGEDLMASTHVHRILQHLLQLAEPVYLHHALVVDENGKRLAKRDESKSLRSLRDSGVKPAELVDQLWRDFPLGISS